MILNPELKMHANVYKEMISYFSQGVCERGCLVGASQFLNCIDAFAPVPGLSGKDYFAPDMDAVNRQIAHWADLGICFCGFIHSHPDGAAFLSYADHIAIESWVRAANLPFLCFGVMGEAAKLKLYLSQELENQQVSIFSMQKFTDPVECEYTYWRRRNE